MNLKLQDAFTMLNLKQDREKLTFENEAQNNYKRLKAMVNDSLVDVENLKEMEDHLRIIQSSGKETSAVIGLKARISSTLISIGKKENLIKNMELEMAELKKRRTKEE